MKKFLALICLLGAFAFTASAQQTNTSFQQQWFFNTTVANVSEPGVAESSLASVHTITWTVTGTVVGTVTLQTSSVSQTGTWSSMPSTVAQNLAASGSYTQEGQTAAFVGLAVNITTCTTCTVNIVYVGTTPAVGTFTDGTFFVPETACFGATTGTAGAGNATDILTGSGGVRVYRVSATAASSSANTFTCVFTVPSRLTAGKGATITDVTILVSTQTTQPTSITLPTLKSFTAPAAVDPETANSATFVTAGGTITQTPSSAQFAAYTPIAAGQFFTVKAALGTPIAVNTDMQTFQFVIVFNQSASAISIQEVPGLIVHYNSNIL